jgi:hypothetical protein
VLKHVEGAIPSFQSWLSENSPIVSLPTGLAVQAILFTVIAYFRLTDTDEGFYLLAAKLVGQGKRPYLDFFFQQMPALPYAYAVWSKMVGISWTSARMLSVLLSVALGGLLYSHVERLYGRKAFACLAVLLYALNNLVLAWHSVVKTYALSNFLLFCAYLLVFPESRPYREWKVFLGGLLFGIAVDTRLYLIAVAPVFMLSFFFSKSSLRIKTLGAFAGGLAVGLLPNLWFLAKAPDAYLFDNLGYHLVRSELGFRSAAHQKFETFLAVTNIQGSYDGSGTQLGLLSLLVIPAVLSRRADRRLLVPMGLALVLFFTCLVPSPTFPQYFCVCIPYLVIVATKSVAMVVESEPSHSGMPFVRSLGLLAAGVYLFCGLLTFFNYAFSGAGVEGVWNKGNVFDYKLSNVREVSSQLGQLVGSNDLVISFWPGYLVECNCLPQRGTENDFAFFISYKLNPGEVDRRKVMTDERVQDLLNRRAVRAVVVRSVAPHPIAGQAVWGGWGISFRDTLRKSGYKLVRTIGRAEIYLVDKVQQ